MKIYRLTTLASMKIPVYHCFIIPIKKNEPNIKNTVDLKAILVIV